MAYRPLVFPHRAPHTGLSAAAGIANGLNHAMNNYAKIKMQRAQMAAHQANAEAMKTWRESQAEALRKKNMGTSLAKAQLWKAMGDNKHIDPAIAKAGTKDEMEAFMANIKDPQEAIRMQQKIEQEYQAGQIPEEFAGDVKFNMNEMRSMDRAATNTSREKVAETQAGAKTYGADQALAGKKYGADKGYAGKVKGAEIGAASAEKIAGMKTTVKDDPANAGDRRILNTLTSKMYSPNASGDMPNDTERQLMWQDYHAAEDRIAARSAARQAKPAQASPVVPQQQSPKPVYLPKDQWQKAAPGDFVEHPKGGGYIRVDQNHNPEVDASGQPKLYHAPGANQAPPVVPSAPTVAPMPPEPPNDGSGQ